MHIFGAGQRFYIQRVRETCVSYIINWWRKLFRITPPTPPPLPPFQSYGKIINYVDMPWLPNIYIPTKVYDAPDLEWRSVYVIRAAIIWALSTKANFKQKSWVWHQPILPLSLSSCEFIWPCNLYVTTSKIFDIGAWIPILNFSHSLILVYSWDFLEM